MARYWGPPLDPPEYDEPTLPHCQCGAWLPYKPERTEYVERAIDCDGSETLEDGPYDDATIAIIGEEFRGQTYKTSYSPCGPEKGIHEPHREVQYVDSIAIWTCKRCGNEHREGGY